MIEVTKLNGEKIVVNADHIESVEGQPDTALVLTNGKRIVIRDKIPDVVRKVVEYQRGIRLAVGPKLGPGPTDPGR
jgi:flagellar protein FlbD